MAQPPGVEGGSRMTWCAATRPGERACQASPSRESYYSIAKDRMLKELYGRKGGAFLHTNVVEWKGEGDTA